MKKSSNSGFGFSGSIALLLLITFTFSNCKPKVEGCLDIEAENFSFSADKFCPDDCCIYPTMTFEIAFRWRSNPLVYNQPLIITFDTVINITKTKFYISDISLTNDTESFRVTDQIELTVNDGSQRTENFVDDFALVSRDFTSFNYEIGDIRGAGSFDTIRFFVGLDELANKVEPNSAPDGHPLAIESDTMWSAENGYVLNKLIVIPEWDTTVKRRIYEVTGDANKVEIVLPFKIDLEVGNNITVPINIDYYEWLRGIDFGADSSTVIVQKIVKNTAQAFSIND